MKNIPINLTIILTILLGNIYTIQTIAQEQYDLNENKFVLIPLGVTGSVDESNLTAYLLSSMNSTKFICLDAGTLWTGLKAATKANSFVGISRPKGSNLTLESLVLREHIKAYLISHAHIDRIAGLIVNSSIDTKKSIFGLNRTIDDIKNHLFNWHIWPNVGDSGVSPYLSKYYYVTLPPKKRVHIPSTDMYVQAFPLKHGQFFESTAFLIQAGNHYALYIGDTEPDEETETPLKNLWDKIVPLIKKHSLRGIFIEVSRPDEQSDKKVEGLLTPSQVMDALQQLARLVNAENIEFTLQGLTVIITNSQPPVLTRETPQNEQIKTQLELLNNLGIRFVFPVQGQRLEF
jgi:3',5'-cyclic-nucleotide phosphodiesterase